MIAIRSPADLAQARLPQNLSAAVSRLLTGIQKAYRGNYDPDDDGHILVITPTDSDTSMTERLGWKWSDSMFEGVSYDSASGVWHVVILRNNQYTLSIMAMDGALDASIRQRLHCQLEGGDHAA